MAVYRRDACPEPEVRAGFERQSFERLVMRNTVKYLASETRTPARGLTGGRGRAGL